MWVIFTMRYFKKLTGNRVYLSPVNPDDLEIYTKWINNLSTTIYLGNSSSVVSLAGEEEILDNMVKGGHNFAIILEEGDKLLGNCYMFDIKPIHRTAEVGLFIGDEENRGKGYGGEALELLLCYGFKILNLNNIMLRVYTFNTRAIKSYEKVGFKRFGQRTESYYMNGRYFDEILMEILAGDFRSGYLDADLSPDQTP
jgi:RimJ/RimL family protein N-acetyltransferase